MTTADLRKRLRDPARSVNMSVAEMRAWNADPRSRLASTRVGHYSLRRLAGLTDRPALATLAASKWNDKDAKWAKKVIDFNERHIRQIEESRPSGRGGFGREAHGSGYSPRHIALLNWGHDPTDRRSAVYEDDQRWLERHPGAAERRKKGSARKHNPSGMTGIDSVENMQDAFSERFSGSQARVTRAYEYIAQTPSVAFSDAPAGFAAALASAVPEDEADVPRAREFAARVAIARLEAGVDPALVEAAVHEGAKLGSGGASMRVPNPSIMGIAQTILAVAGATDIVARLTKHDEETRRKHESYQQAVFDPTK